MGLKKYQAKRNFNSTREPKGKTEHSGKELIFVVQKHAASHLHYDFRLEMEGVLKSWAVPKGPSLNPDDKRLAMMVEDHPYSYKDFEGNIPEGNYGAGNVIVWDNGTYESIEGKGKEGEKKLLAGIHKGHLSFILHGHKLKGEFSLIKLKGKQENAWLLVKKKDKYAAASDVLKKNRSVISKVTLEQLAKKNSKKEKKPVTKKTPKTRAPELPQTEEISPMLAEVAETAFDDRNWIFEVKYDGYRTLARVDGKGKVELFSRNHLSFNKKFKPVADELAALEHAAILDGEIVIENEKGRSGFQLLQNYQKTRKGKLKYYVFDILNLDGNDTRGLSLLERKELLKMLLQPYRFPNILYSEHVVEKGKSFYKKAIRNKQEGVMGKNAESPYRSGNRSKDWLKIRIIQQEEAIICGVTQPRGSRHHFGSLLLGRYDGKKLEYIGNCGTGFTEAGLKELYQKLQPYFRETSPFEEKIRLSGPIQWIAPHFVCQVKFTEWTGDRHLRHPVFLGLRIDKKAGEITAAAPPVKIEKAKKQNEVKVGKVNLQLTNQDKIYFPEDKLRKGDVISYYNEMAELMLPYLKDRPQSMNRFPNGIHGPSFYQKDVEVAKVPSWLQTAHIYSESNEAYIDYLVCNDKATLLYMANLGCIDINPWNSTIENPEHPDWMVIDLDPEKIEFKEVVKTALTVKDVFDELGIKSYCKTSGATGLHIYVPMGARYHYDVVKTFAQLIAQTVHERLPGITSIERMPKKRQQKVYVDFLQNRRGQTLAAPYSLRPRLGATVSTPLEWEEVNYKLSPFDFTIHTIFQRLEKKGDLWKPVLGKGIDLEKMMKRLEEETGGDMVVKLKKQKA